MEAWAEGFKTIISETESRGRLARRPVELGSTQYSGPVCQSGWLFSSWVQLPRCGCGKDRCVSKPTVAVLTGECNRRAKREKNLLGCKRDSAGNPLPHGHRVPKAQLWELRPTSYLVPFVEFKPWSKYPIINNQRNYGKFMAYKKH